MQFFPASWSHLSKQKRKGFFAGNYNRRCHQMLRYVFIAKVSSSWFISKTEIDGKETTAFFDFLNSTEI